MIIHFILFQKSLSLSRKLARIYFLAFFQNVSEILHPFSTSTYWNVLLLLCTTKHANYHRLMQPGKISFVKSKCMENIPPTQDALLQHTKLVWYYASAWSKSHIHQQQRPSPDGWEQI